MLEDLGILTEQIRAKREAQQALPIAEEGPAPSNGGNGNGESKPAAAALTETPPVIPATMSPTGDLGPACDQCGGMMQRTGTCYTCSSCGNNTGCG